MKFKCNITHMKDFLRTVENCRGRVVCAAPGGATTPLQGNAALQAALLAEDKATGFVPLELTVSDPADYMRLVCTAIA